MSAETPSPSSRPAWIDPRLFGLGCGLGSAVGYTAANICLRAVAHCDPVWVSAIKALPTLILVGPWLAVLAFRGERVFPSLRVLGLLSGAGLVAHLGGNVAFQWSLGVIGIALAVPITLGTMILGGAVLGRVFLHEGITPRAAGANAILILAIVVLSLGAGESTPQEADFNQAAAAGWTLLGVLAACVSGLAYATLGVVIRYGVSGEARVTTTIVSISFVGFVALGGLAQMRIGMEGMLATGVSDFSIMASAGVFNALAFLALTKALQSCSVVLVNALNSTQAAMALAAGVLLFDEPLTTTLAIGVTMTAAGLLLMEKGSQKRTAAVGEKLPEAGRMAHQNERIPLPARERG